MTIPPPSPTCWARRAPWPPWWGSSLKFEGRLIVQAQGKGPVGYVVADYDTSGGLRGYCSFDAGRVAQASRGFVRPGARTLLGEGVFIMTVDPVDARGPLPGRHPHRGRGPWPCARRPISPSPSRCPPACAWRWANCRTGAAAPTAPAA